MNSASRTEADQKRRRREVIIIIAVLPLIVFLTYLESHITIISNNVPIPANILILGLINLNIILLVVVIFLVLRNMVKIFFERKRKVMGSKLMTRLITAFVSLSIIPTMIFFFVVIAFINRSIDGWFNIKIEDSLQESLELGQNYYRDMKEKMLSGARIIAVSASKGTLSSDASKIRDFIYRRMEENDYSTIEVFNARGRRIMYFVSDTVEEGTVPDVNIERMKATFSGEPLSFVQSLTLGDVVRGSYPVVFPGPPRRVIGAVVVSYHVPLSLVDKMKEISTAFEGYKQMKLLKNPVKTSYFVILLIIMLLIVFFSIWIGRYLARGITVPIYELANGTNEVAGGNLDFHIDVESDDEIGLLVRSFNRMTEDLKAGKTRIEEANLDLRKTNTELEQRRRYMDIVLDNVTAGILSIDRHGTITSINRVAAEILGTDEEYALHKSYRDVLREEDRHVFKELIRHMNEIGAQSMEKQLSIKVGEKTIMVLVNLNALRDDSGNYLGMVAVLDDLTHLLKTQRMQAWKEVAKRIAHEIKNPLTPIKLSAQRLRKKYLNNFTDTDIFDECTDTIIKQVDELKVLVDEFSNFARMPAVNPSPNDLNGVVRETVALYKTGQKNITYNVFTDESMPTVNIDRDQIKRALINLFDNAAAALDGSGVITVRTRYDSALQLARVEVIDNGTGIEPDARERLFEPYFSTKKTGTGLGLAIVNNIISDHNGYIRVKDNPGGGTIFIIELPVRTVNV